MSSTNNEEQTIVNNDPTKQVHNDLEVQTGHANISEENSMPSAQEEEAAIKKKYGGIIPKKKPLISKDHERAFFDSADWALNKQGGQKPKGPLEALRPKLQPTPHHQARSRRSAYASADFEGDNPNGMNPTDDHHDGSGDDEKNTTMDSENQSGHN